MGPEVIEWALAGRPIPGEVESGDRGVVTERPPGALIAVIDGLGHGSPAAEAAARAAQALLSDPRAEVLELIQRCHDRLQGTRGAVLGVAIIDDAQAAVTWGGVGNVDGTVFHVHGGRDSLTSLGGVVGDSLPQVLVRSVPLTPGDTVVLSSDGIRGGWAGHVSPSLTVQQIATQVSDGFGRPTDDALVLAVRWLGARR